MAEDKKPKKGTDVTVSAPVGTVTLHGEAVSGTPRIDAMFDAGTGAKSVKLRMD